MRKDALKRLLFRYQADLEERKEVPDVHVAYLKEFLETEEEILLLNDDENVPVAKFAEFLEKNHSKENKLAEIFAQGHSIDADVKVALAPPDDKMISTFIKPTYVFFKKENSYVLVYCEQGKKIKDIPLVEVPGLLDEIQKTFRDKSIPSKIKNYHLNLPKVKRAKFFKTFLEHEPLDWKQKLFETSCNKELLQGLIALNIISSYEVLYKILVRLGRDKQKIIASTWELLCLSGDIPAVRHVIDKSLIDAKSENAWKTTPWDLAVLSQSTDTPRMIADKFPTMKKIVNEKQKLSSATTASVQQTIASSAITIDRKDEKTSVRKEDKATFTIAMEPNIFSHVRKFFDEKSAANTTVNRFLDSSIKRGNAYWQEQLIKLGVDKKLLEVVIQLNVIKNYKYLYEVIHHLKKIDWSLDIFKDTRKLLCLSKEPRAVKYLMDNNLINKDTKDEKGRAFLHLVYLSGSADSARLAMKIPDIDLRVTTLVGSNVVHYAFCSGSLETAKLAMTIPNIDLRAKTSNGWNAVLFAFRHGSLEIARLAMAIPNIDLWAKIANGWNAVHYAIGSGSLEKTKLVLSIANMNLLATVKCFLPLEATLVNIFHIAAYAGSADVIIYLRQELHKRNLKLTPEAKDSNGHDAFWYVEQSGKNVELMKAALACPVDKLNTFFADFENQQKKSVAASNVKDEKARSVSPVRK